MIISLSFIIKLFYLVKICFCGFGILKIEKKPVIASICFYVVHLF